MLQLKVILASTRPTRKGPSVANWFMEIASKHEGFKAELLDLAAIDLPLMNEPQHPVLRQYEHQHTKDWSGRIDSGDAFVFVTAEYNHGFPAPLKNALDYLVHEWTYKPVGFVSYGGIAGGTRSVQMLKQVVNALKMTALGEGVHIPAFTKYIDEQGIFKPEAGLDKAAGGMLNELHRWATTLKTMRENKPA